MTKARFAPENLSIDNGTWFCSSPTTFLFFVQTTWEVELNSMSGLDQDALRYALQTAKDRGFRVIKLKSGDEHFRARLTIQDFVDESELDLESESQPTPTQPSNEHIVTAPVVGYFREVGKKLVPGTTFDKGETLGEIVSLGLANDVVSPLTGEIIEVMIQSGEAVEFGQSLAIMEPA